MRIFRYSCCTSFACYGIVILGCMICSSIHTMAQSSNQPNRALIRQLRREAGALAMVNMPSVAPLFLEDARFSSTIYIVNEGTPTVTGRLTLLTPDGRIISNQVVPVSGHDKMEIPLKSLLSSAHSTAAIGCIELFDDNVDGSALAGEVVITFHGEAGDINLDEELLMPTMSQSHQLRGIAIEAVASPVVSISSRSDQPAEVMVKCVGERSKATQVSFQIRSHQIVTLRPCADSAIVDGLAALNIEPNDLRPADTQGITITSSDPNAEIQAFGLSPTVTNGHLSFTSIAFYDPDDALSNETVYPGVPIGYVAELSGTFHPRVSVQNYASESRAISVYKARTTSDSSSLKQVAVFTVGPNGVKSADLADDADSADAVSTFIVKSDGQVGDIQNQLWSEDDNSQSRVIFAGKDSKDDRNTGMHPWTLKNGVSDNLILFNETGFDQPVNLKLNNGLILWKKVLTLRPYETRKLSIRELAAQGSLDDSRVPFTSGSGGGEVSWYTSKPAVVRGRLEHKDSRRHLISSFQCAGYTVFCGIGSISGPSTITNGQSGQFSDYDVMSCVNNEAPNQCYGVESGNYSGATFQWSADPGLSLQAPIDFAWVTAVGASPGAANIYFQAYNASCYYSEYTPVQVNQGCPSTVSVGPVTQYTLSEFSSDVPSPLSTGIGIVAGMQVGPSSSNWDGAQISESVRMSSNTCPSWGNSCSGSSTFTVGQGGAAVASGVTLGNFDSVNNQFYDQHTVTSGSNFLKVYNVQSCQTVCTQTYSCGGTPIGNFTITQSYTRGTVGSSAVTNVGITKH